MSVRPKKVQSRKAEPKPPASAYSFPSPTRGWVLNENLAQVGPGSALILDNWICTTRGIKVRGGTSKYATVTNPVTSVFAYNSGGSEKLFAATADSVFDITTVADPDVAPTADITGQTAGDYTAQPFSTAGGDYMYIVNGDDSPQLYDGSTWTAITGVSSPAITGVTTSLLSHVWAYASRLFFVELNSMNAWYLPVDSIGGAASSFSLAGVFKLGGSLLFGATWSLDAGDGLDDKCVFVSTEGEVAIYEGTNPGSAADWRLAGVYQITKPLGASATMRAGGDLLIATNSGLVPLSQAINKDKAALSMDAVSAPIQTYWEESLIDYPLPWHIAKWPEKNIMVIAMSSTAEDDNTLVCNLQTGAWSRFTNIGARCLVYYDGYVYAGGNDGIVKRLESTGSDMGTPYTAIYLGNHEGLDASIQQKTLGQARAKFRAGHAINPLVSAQVDYSVDVSTSPSSIADFTDGLWDSGLWDQATWDGGENVSSVVSNWQSVGRTGYAIAPELQLTFGVTPIPNVELVAIDVTYYGGALVA